MLESQIPRRGYTDLIRPLPLTEEARFYPRSERYHTFRALSQALKNAFHIRDFHRDRYIIFSDLHKGNRHPKLDDFQRTEPVYNQALCYYLNQDYRLVVNGDAEEGWKIGYDQIVEAYEHTTYALEREFGERDYFRTYGNHDNDLADPRWVDRYLKPVLGAIRVHPAIILGSRIVIAHGHQGDRHSDRTAWLSRRAVRHVWRPVQRLTGLQRPRRASENHTDYLSRDEHLSAWARANHLMLIAGHTHRPMLNADHEGPVFSPHYINDGCCVHDNAITGLELDRGEIRLVKWDTLRRTVLKSADLGALLARL